VDVGRSRRADAVDALGALVDGSLVREQDRGRGRWFTMLATVREYGAGPSRRARAADRGARSGTPTSTWDSAVAADAARDLAGQVERVTRLLDEHDELRAAVDHLFATPLRRRRGWSLAAVLVLVGRRPRRRSSRVDDPLLEPVSSSASAPRPSRSTA
jgi:hypothetical protein